MVTHLLNPRPQGKNVSQAKLDEWNRVQRLIEEVHADLVNGVLRSDIFRKFHERQYDNLSQKDIGDRQIQKYIQAAQELIRFDRIERVDELRELLFSQYMQQYAEATAMGNPVAAKAVLDSIAKIFLPDEKTLNLQATINGDLEIDFNLVNED